ncbi:MAG TPA: AI-2E family transporter [Anaerolineae bacterium]|nr:AI-2E family transporter [Anaerolineae bacterium]
MKAPTPSSPAASPEPPPNRETPPPSSSPPWSPTTKLIVGLTLVALLFGALIYFRAYIVPLALAFILAYLLHPVAAWLDRHTPLPWRAVVALLYLALVLLLLGVLTLSGLALVQQAQSLYTVVSDFLLTTLPSWLSVLQTHPFVLGPFTLDFTRFDFNTLSQNLLTSVQPLLGQLGSLISGLASRTLQALGWTAFVLLVSYFLLAEAGQVSVALVRVEIPDYQADLERMGRELGRIWNAFLRGQLMIALMVGLVNGVLLGALGVRNALVLAMLVVAGRFVPYLGPLVVYIITGVVILLQPQHPWGMTALQHVLVVVGSMMFVDQVFDSVVVPQMMGDVLGVHPAAVLVGALVLARLVGILGLLLAAPTVASLRLIGHYILAKLADHPNPWEGLQPASSPTWPLLPSLVKLWRRLRRR